METKIAIMRPFFEDPDREFQIRELSRIVKINHTTVRKYLNGLVKESLLKKDKIVLIFSTIHLKKNRRKI